MKFSYRVCLGLVLLCFCVPVLAKAPEALSVVLNGKAMKGKALWYKERVYVPLEDVASTLDGSYQLDPESGRAEVNFGTPRLKNGQNAFGILSVKSKKEYVAPDNATVVATVRNIGQAPLTNVQGVCEFRDGSLRELRASIRDLGTIAPGQSKIVEFRLYDQPAQVFSFCPECGFGTGVARRDQVIWNGGYTRVRPKVEFTHDR